jgi:hypothetical protein
MTDDLARAPTGGSEWPTADNTGYRSAPGTPVTGDYTSTSNGQTISGLDVTSGTIIIAHDDVVVEDCAVDTAGVYGIQILAGSTGAIVRYNTVTGAQTGIFGFGYFHHNDISGVENGVVIANGDNTTILDNYIHDLFAAVEPHYDGIAAHGSCDTILIGHNWIEGGGGQGVYLSDEQGAADDITVTDNYIADCSYNITCGDAGVTNATVTDNVLQQGSSGFYNFTALGMTVSGNVSTRGIYIDGDAPPTVGTVAFQPTNAVTTSSDLNNGLGLRVVATLAAAIPSEFRVVLFSGATGGLEMDSCGFGKQSAADVATGALTSIEFGGTAAPIEIAVSRYLVSDWIPIGGLTFGVGDEIMIGFATNNPGGTGLSISNSNVTSYFGTAANALLADPDYAASANNCFALARIEAR